MVFGLFGSRNKIGGGIPEAIEFEPSFEDSDPVAHDDSAPPGGDCTSQSESSSSVENSSAAMGFGAMTGGKFGGGSFRGGGGEKQRMNPFDDDNDDNDDDVSDAGGAPPSRGTATKVGEKNKSMFDIEYESEEDGSPERSDNEPSSRRRRRRRRRHEQTEEPEDLRRTTSGSSNPFDNDSDEGDDHHEQQQQPLHRRASINPFDDSGRSDGDRVGGDGGGDENDDVVVPSPPPPHRAEAAKQHQQPQEDDPIGSSNRAKFEEIMSSYDDKLLGFDDSKFSGSSEDEDEDDDEEGERDEERRAETTSSPDKKKKKGKKERTKNLKHLFNLKGSLTKNRSKKSADRGRDGDRNRSRSSSGSTQDAHRRRDEHEHEHEHDDNNDEGSVYTDSEEGSYISGEDESYISGEETDEGSYISGEEDYGPKDDRRQRAALQENGEVALSPEVLAEELYAYKLETLHLTDACRELAEELESTESKLESVQAQATFRIHALESELSDGNVGLKSLVKMTSVEMDSRLDALRALGRTASIQATRLRDRDLNLVRMEKTLARSNVEVRSLRREVGRRAREKKKLNRALRETEIRRSELEGAVERLMRSGGIDRRSDRDDDGRQERRLTTRGAERRDGENKHDSADADVGGRGGSGDSGERATPTMKQFEDLEVRLSEALDKLDAATTRSEDAEREAERRSVEGEKFVAEIADVRDELGRREHDVVRVELQLEQVREAIGSSNEARLQAEARCDDARDQRDEAFAALEEAEDRAAAALECGHLALATSGGDETEKWDDGDDNDKAKIEEEEREKRQRWREDAECNAAELQSELEGLRTERDRAVQDAAEERAARFAALAGREEDLQNLRKEVTDHQKGATSAKSALVEKEAEVSSLREQLNRVWSEDRASLEQTKEDLAAGRRELSAAEAELEARSGEVAKLEDKLKLARRDLAAAEVEREERKTSLVVTEEEEEEEFTGDIMDMPPIVPEQIRSVPSSPSSASHAAAVATAEKELQVESLERELGTSQRSLEAVRAEVEEKEKIIVRLRGEVCELWDEHESTAREHAARLEETKEIMDGLREDAEARTITVQQSIERLEEAEAKLVEAETAAVMAGDARRSAESAAEESGAAELEVGRRCDRLEEEVGELRMSKVRVETERDVLVAEWTEERAVSKVAEERAVKDAERQTEMEMQIERMQNDIDFKQREIETIKTKLHDKDRISVQLKLEIGDVRNEMANYKAQVESEKEQVALAKIAEREYFGDDMSVASEHTAVSNVSSGLNMFKRFSKANTGDTEEADWEGRLSEKDFRIGELERALTLNELNIANLNNELLSASSKFKQDERQRRLMCQRLESENSAYSIKLEVLENEFQAFNAIQKREESNPSSAYGLSGLDDASNFSDMGSSVFSGASGMPPLEKENKVLKKQKCMYENRISSLQMQLSEIQQIVPELMSKSKSQIQKLEGVIQTQKHDAECNEMSLREEIVELRMQNGQLQAATRSRLQASDAERQNEIVELKMRVAAGDAAIEQLKLKSKSRGSLLKKRRGKSKKKGLSDEASAESMSTAGQSIRSTSFSAYSHGAKSLGAKPRGRTPIIH